LQKAVWGDIGQSTSSPVPNLLEDSGGLPKTVDNSSFQTTISNNITEEVLDAFNGNNDSVKAEAVNNNVTVEDSLEDLGGLLVDSRLGLEELEGFFHSLGVNQTEEEPSALTSNSSIKLLEDLKEILEISVNSTDANNSRIHDGFQRGNETQAIGIFSSLMDIIVDIEGNSTESSNSTSY